MAAAAVDNHNAMLSCLDDPNFATICSFIDKFGESCNLGDLPFDFLQEMLENTTEVSPRLVQIHIQLLRRVYKSINTEKWEKHLAKFGHSYNAQDGWEIERFGYKKAKISTKLRLLKTLLEAQFDYNVKFKNEVNKLPAEDLRRQPIGRDSEGQLYWYQVDPDANLRIYREDADEETWEVVASNREEMLQLIEDLSCGVVKKNSNIEDENGDLSELSPKEILLDTGKVDEPANDEDEVNGGDDNVDDDYDDDDAMQIDETYNPPAEEKTEQEISEPESDSKNSNKIGVSDLNSSSTQPTNKSDIHLITLDESDRSEPKAEQIPSTNLKKSELETGDKSEHLVSRSSSANIGSNDISKARPDATALSNNTMSDSKGAFIPGILELESRNQCGSKDFKVPVTSKLQTESFEPANIDIWNPAVQEPKNAKNHENLKLGNAYEANSSLKNQRKVESVISDSSSNRKQSTKKTKRDPSPLENLQLFTQKMSSEPNTLTEDLRKVTSEGLLEENETSLGEREYQCKQENDYGERFMKPEASVRKFASNTMSACPEILQEPISAIEQKDKSSKPNRKIGLTSINQVPATQSTQDIQIDNPELIIAKTKEQKEPVPAQLVPEVSVSQESNQTPPVETDVLNAEKSVDSDTKEVRTTATTEGPQTSSSNSATEDSKSGNPENLNDQQISCTHNENEVQVTASETSSSLNNKLNVEENTLTDVEINSLRQGGINENIVQDKFIDRHSSIEESSLISSGKEIPTPLELVSKSENSSKTLSDVSIDTTNTSNLSNKPADSELQSANNFNLKEEEDFTKKMNETETEIERQNQLLSPVPVVGELVPENLKSSCSMNDEVLKNQDVEAEPSIPALVLPTEFDNSNIPTTSASNFDNNMIPDQKEEQTNDPSLKKLKGDEMITVAQKESTLPDQVAELELAVQDHSNDPILENPAPLMPNEVKPSILSTAEAKSQNIVPEQVEIVEQPIVKSTTWLVGYDESSEEEDKDLLEKSASKESNNSNRSNTEDPISSKVISAPIVEEKSSKRKTEDSSTLSTNTPPEKISKLEVLPIGAEAINPIVGEAIEEETMLIIGEGSGMELQGGNERLEESSDEPQESKTRGRGRPKRKEERKPKSAGATSSRRKSFGSDLNDLTPTERNVAELNGCLSSERPMRQSRRIAQIREKEEEERRRLEEEHLAQLKKAQLQKKKKEQEHEQTKVPKKSPEKVKPTKTKGKTKAVSKSKKPVTQYAPSPSASDSESDEENDEETYEIPKGKKKRGRKPKKNGEEKFKKGLKPWLHSSSDEEDDAVEEEEEAHEEEEEIAFDKSDHEFSPESDLGEDEEVSPSRHARTVKIGPISVDKYANTFCEKCSKGDHPEWILLCDECDKGWHASCVVPQLWVIPEGAWFCPPCQHRKLVEKLGESLVEFDKILKKRENEELRRKRLAFVGISLENILPPENDSKRKDAAAHKSSKHKKRRRILSDEDESDLNVDNFIDDNEDEDDGSKSSRFNSEDESDVEPMYKLRARRATKTFNFKEYDDLINDALKDEDEYELGDNANAESNAGITSQEKDSNVSEKNKQESVNGNAQSEKLPENVSSESAEKERNDEEEDEKEITRLKELEKASHRKTRRRLNDLDATSDEDSDEDFKGSNDEDEDEDDENAGEDDSEWSGDREADDSDESIARAGRRGRKQEKYGRREKYLEVGSVRRSTRRSKAKIQYDESDQEDDDDDVNEAPGSNENSETNSESEDDETWGKRKKQKKAPYNPPRSSNRKFFIPESSRPKRRSAGKKKKRIDSDEEDRPWNKGGSRSKKIVDDSVQQRTTRGKKINFRDILDLESGESDDDGNIRPKRRRILSESDDSEGPSSSKKLAAELSAANLRAAAEANKEQNDDGAKVKEKDSGSSNLVKEAANVNQKESPKPEPISVHRADIPVPEELKPVPAPPYPPVRNQLLEALKKVSEPSPKLPPSQSNPPSTSLLMSEILAAPPIRFSPPSSNSKKNSSPVTAVKSQPPHLASPLPLAAHRGMSPQHIPPNEPRIPDPSLFQRAQALRAFHPAWGGRNPVPPPPYGNHSSPSAPRSVGNPPPLNSIPFMSQSSSRSPYPTPPPLRIPNPNATPLQSFHQFKREVGLPMYRLPPNLAGLPPRAEGLLPQMHPGLGHPHLDRFYGPPGGSPFVYGIPPPHTQSQSLFSAPQPYEYRPEESFKEQTRGSSTANHGTKEEINPVQGSGEFGGLVSYFSMQRGDDDMDT